MRQANLFDTFDQAERTPAARRTDPVTSHVAAAEYESKGNAESDRAAILNAIRTARLTTPAGYPLHGITSGELAAILGDGWTNVRVSRRLPEIEKTGAIIRGMARICTSKKSLMLTWHLYE